ncbi:MAG: EscU/YscU/HrcU family type III secretion system export apparatus switch protein, partial [Pseudomonadota bacterium]
FALGLFVIGAAVAVLFYSHLRDFVKIPASGMHGVLTVGASVFLKLMSFVIPLFFAMAAVDYLFKRFIWAQDLRMTKDEVKRERKGQNGNPMMKSQLRKIGREMQEADNLEQFDFATLVLHDDGGQMVAIYFNPEQSPLPWVLCKSQGAMTEELLAHAAQKGMRMQHDDVLTRILFSRCRVNQFIPEEVADELGSMLR